MPSQAPAVAAPNGGTESRAVPLDTFESDSDVLPVAPAGLAADVLDMFDSDSEYLSQD